MAAKNPKPGMTIRDCTFTNQPPDPLSGEECDAVREIARALSANARALEALASNMRPQVNQTALLIRNDP